MVPSSSGQDAGLSRRKPGFDSRWDHHRLQRISANLPKSFFAFPVRLRSSRNFFFAQFGFVTNFSLSHSKTILNFYYAYSLAIPKGIEREHDNPWLPPVPDGGPIDWSETKSGSLLSETFPDRSGERSSGEKDFWTLLQYQRREPDKRPGSLLCSESGSPSFWA